YTENNSNANKIYGMVVDSRIYGYAEIFTDNKDYATNVKQKSKFEDLLINLNDIPLLMKIQNGTVKDAFITQNDIRRELDNAMHPVGD
ncbi:MAG: hypothetical protein GX661_00260, partial [Acholeplasmataceae bacterium]|nr:hypothetical protein [Acholeplasmataceae bacterium]